MSIKNSLANKCNEEVPRDAIESDVGKCYNDNDDFFCQWMVQMGTYYIPKPKIKLTKKVPAGFYRIEWNGEERINMLVKSEILCDELLKFPYDIFDSILHDINYFWENEAKFKEYKYSYKRGILLHGPPGNGKTCITMLLSKKIIDKGGIIFSINNSNSLENYYNMLPIIRSIESNTPILTLIEDLDSLLVRAEVETLLLNILDGINQTHNIVYVACTNYPEKLKERILNRPSRFDRRYYIGYPDAKIREFYFKNKIKKSDLNKIDMNEWVEKTKGLSIAHLGEIIKSVFIFNKTLDITIQELRDMSKFLSSSKYEKVSQNGVGFVKEV